MKLYVFIFAFVATISYSQEFTKAIEDNSFFIEEAYNQEANVIQHIFNGTTFSPGNILETSFTEEWPIFDQKHQLSITVPYQYSLAGTRISQGISDLMVNYRYQFMNEHGLAVAPRVSIILPTGDNKNGSGNGAVGVQLNLPVSKRFSDEIVTHYNAGYTVIPNARSSSTPSKETVSEYLFGASAIYLANKSFNVMAEVLYTSSSSPLGRTNELIVSPGVRWAIDIGELQIVPGLAFPIHFVNGNKDDGFVLYLSFEHSY
ncbi:MAG: transporter [Bacteroidota bacterium]